MSRNWHFFEFGMSLGKKLWTWSNHHLSVNTLARVLVEKKRRNGGKKSSKALIRVV